MDIFLLKFAAPTFVEAHKALSQAVLGIHVRKVKLGGKGHSIHHLFALLSELVTLRIILFQLRVDCFDQDIFALASHLVLVQDVSKEVVDLGRHGEGRNVQSHLELEFSLSSILVL